MLSRLLSFFSLNKIPEQSQVISHTQIGDRKYNEDALGEVTVYSNPQNKTKRLGQFLIVCDGMGGHSAGDLTAQTLVKCFIEQIQKVNKALTVTSFQKLYETSVSNMQRSFKAAHGEINGHSTLSCIWLDDSKTLSLHVGDSRAYHLGRKNINWRTRDHSVVQILLDEGEITEQEMGGHPDQNKLFKSISVLSDTLDKATIKEYPALPPGDSILVCSDGFWEYLTPKELLKLSNKLSQSTLEKYCNLCQKRANGKSDNISVVIFKQGLA